MKCSKSVVVVAITLIGNTSCMQVDDETSNVGPQTGGGQTTEGEWRPRIPVITHESPEEIRSAFFAVQGSRLDDETAERLGPLWMAELQMFIDREGVEWRPAVGSNFDATFAGEWIPDFNFISDRPLDLKSYDSLDCDEGCTLRIYASSTIDFTDITQTELSWESQPEQWHYAEVDFNPEIRRETNGLIEYAPDTMDAVAALMVLWLGLEEDGRLTAEMRTHHVVGYNRARRNLRDVW